MSHLNSAKKPLLEKESLYDFTGCPLWNEYFHKTRSKAKFPRGYKEVSIYS